MTATNLCQAMSGLTVRTAGRSVVRTHTYTNICVFIYTYMRVVEVPKSSLLLLAFMWPLLISLLVQSLFYLALQCQLYSSLQVNAHLTLFLRATQCGNRYRLLASAMIAVVVNVVRCSNAVERAYDKSGSKKPKRR